MHRVSETKESNREAPEGSQGEGLVAEAEERRLVEACQRGNLEAFDQLIQLFQNQVFGLAYHLLRDHDEAEDIAQEVFLSFFRHAAEFRFESRLGTWFYRVTVNRVKNRWKYHQRRQRDKHDSLDEPFSEEDPRVVELPDPGPDPRQQAQTRELKEALERHLAELTPEFREVMVLRFGQNLSYEEIAEVLECSIGTVKSRINRARHQLRESMRDLL